MTLQMIKAHSTHMLDKLRNAVGWFRYQSLGPFRLHPDVKKSTFVRMGPKRVDALEETHVVAVARQMEATLVMVEEMEPRHEVMLTVTAEQLAHFVHYMRQLDSMYRRQDMQVQKQNERITELESRQKII